MLLKRAPSYGAGSGLGSLHPMTIASRPSKLLPVLAVVVVMFFVAVYRVTLMLDRPVSEGGAMRTPTWGAAGVGGSVTIDEFTDPELAHSPHREQLGTLKAVQSEIASETARLAEEVRRMSQSVKESAQRVNEMPELIDVPVKPAVPSRGKGESAFEAAQQRVEEQRRASMERHAAFMERRASFFEKPWEASESRPIRSHESRAEKISGEGDFPRPEPGAPTGAGGKHAKMGMVPSGRWARVEADVVKRDAVKEAMKDAYGAYEKYAMGFDELQPLTQHGKNGFGGLGATIIDSLDTLWIMGLSEQYSRARNWVAERLHFNKNYEASVFETTIRIVGGLVAAYDLSGDAMYLEKCTALVEALMPAFRTTTGIPYNQINLASGRAKNPAYTRGASTLAEFGTLQMEFIALSQRTGNRRWSDLSENIVNKVREVKYNHNVPRGLYPLKLNPHTGKWMDSKVSFGAMGDSWYEYLLKVWVMGGRTEAMQTWHDDWVESMEAMITKLVFRGIDDTMYVGEYSMNHVIHKMDHLACFVGGMLVLGAEGSKHEERFMEVAAGITKTCYHMYTNQPTGIAPEYVNFRDRKMHAGARYNIQRPEAIEAIFYMYRKTGDEMYRNWAWEMFTSMVTHYKTPTGWTGLKDVRMNPPHHDNTMQSFFLAETLKYFYLIFCDSDTINLDEWVFNTEAHPIKVTPRNSSLVKAHKFAGNRRLLQF